jgi:hypothetical protein
VLRTADGSPGETGAEPWAVEYRAVPNGRGYLVSVVNLWGKPKRVALRLNGRPVRHVTDLRQAGMRTGGRLELQPLRAMLLRID